MSLTMIKPYFDLRCKAVGLTPVGDIYNADEIASTVIDLGYIVEFFTASGLKLNQNDQEISAPVDVIFFVKGFRYPQDGFNKAVVKIEELIREVEFPANRLGSCLKNVSLSQINIDPLSIDNDNLIKVTITFDVITNLSL